MDIPFLSWAPVDRRKEMLMLQRGQQKALDSEKGVRGETPRNADTKFLRLAGLREPLPHVRSLYILC